MNIDKAAMDLIGDLQMIPPEQAYERTKQALSDAFKQGWAEGHNKGYLEGQADAKHPGMREAMTIIEKVGTTGIEYEHLNAQQWLLRYFPEHA